MREKAKQSCKNDLDVFILVLAFWYEKDKGLIFKNIFFYFLDSTFCFLNKTLHMMFLCHFWLDVTFLDKCVISG